MSQDKPTVRFRLTDDAVLVESWGKGVAPFSDRGFITIVYDSLSGKVERPFEKYAESSGRELVREIRKRILAKDSLDHASADSREKQDTSGQDGRFVYELLQNADDAIGKKGAAESIGAKGLGFRSVLNITNKPEIHSGEFHFALEKKLLPKDPCETHVRIPREAPELPKDEHVVTQIHLPFKDEKARQDAWKEIEKIKGEYLLFCQDLQAIEIHTSNMQKVFSISKRGKIDESGEIIVRDLMLIEEDGKGNLVMERKWRRWLCKPQESMDGEERKHINAAVCLPFDEGNKKIVPCKDEDERSLRVFFPTEKEKIDNLLALMHVSCSLETNRKYFSDKQPNCEQLCNMVKKLIGGILHGSTKRKGGTLPCETLLRAFGKIKKTELSAMSDLLGNAIVEAVAETAFIPVIGGRHVTPREVVQWKYGIGDVLNPSKAADKNLLVPAIQENEEVTGILSRYSESEQLIDDRQAHAVLLQQCRNFTDKDCLAALRCAAEICLDAREEEWAKIVEELTKIPFWKMDKSARALTGRRCLLFKKPSKWPNWIKFDTICPRFGERIKREKVKVEEGEPETLKTVIEVWPLSSPLDYLSGALLPFCERSCDGMSERQTAEWWKSRGWKILDWAHRWSALKQELPALIVGDDDKHNRERNRAGQVIRLPTSRGWLPAIDCYAGKEWDGPSSFDDFFRKKRGRGVVSPLEKWSLSTRAERDKQRWKGFLRWLGVAWEPKIRRSTFSQLASEQRPVELLGPESLIRKYQDGCRDKCYSRYQRGYIQQKSPVFFMEYFPASMEASGVDLLHAAASVMQALKGKGKVMCERQYLGTRPYEVSCDTLAVAQLKNLEWLPCTPGVFDDVKVARPQDIYMPGCGRGGMYPEVIEHEDRDKKIKNALDMLECKGPKEVLSKSTCIENMRKLRDKANGLKQKWENQQLQWNRDTGGHSGRSEERGRLADVARILYTEYLREYGDLPDHEPVPFVYRTDKGEFLDFAIANDVCWADKYYFDEPSIRDEILTPKHRLQIFFLFLQDGNANRSKLNCLSEKLRMEENPIWDKEEDPFGSNEIMRSRFKNRKHMLETALKCQFPNALKILCHKKIYWRSKQLPQLKPEMPFWFDATENCLHVNIGGVRSNPPKWRPLANGLAEVVETDNAGQSNRARGDAIYKFLSEDNDGCKQILREEYGFTEEALRIEEEELREIRTHDLNKESQRRSVSEDVKTSVDPDDEESESTQVSSALGRQTQRQSRSGVSSPKQGSGGGGKSGGGGGDPAVRKVIETVAIQSISRHYEQECGKGKYRIQSVEGDNKGWDLEILDGAEKLVWRVEVKGLSKDLHSVGLTPNEYDACEHQDYRLAIVARIDPDNSEPDNSDYAIYKKEGERWRRVGGPQNGTDMPEWLSTERKTGALVKPDSD